MFEDCPFCQRVERGDYWVVMAGRDEICVAFAPLNPVTKGHLLVLPRRHVEHGDPNGPRVLGAAMECAAAVARHNHASFNLITSYGEPATQTVPHIHVHVVPRTPEDGLALPWAMSDEK